MSYDIDLMVRVSHLYYKCGLKQESVARELNISKYKVTRILKRALSSGVVQIKINEPAVDSFKFENDFEKNFNSKGCFIGSKS